MKDRFPEALRHISVSIARDAVSVYAFAGNPLNLPTWAPGLGSAVVPDGQHWKVATAQGTVGLRFTPRNDWGILDHTVVLPGGMEVYVPLRVIPHGAGSEITFVLFRQLGMTDAEFERDTGLVLADLNRLKALMEK